VSDCDCGRPEVLSFGRHCCKYYGDFNCGSCGNKWTSANTWKNEAQDCRRCDKPCLPQSTRPLVSGLSTRIKGAHDRDRCSKCRRLGFDCSGR
jgi:hypothetical protein